MMMSNGNRKWLDFVSDIDERESEKLLPNSQEIREEGKGKSRLEVNNKTKDKNQIRMKNPDQNPDRTNYNRMSDTFKNENTLINWLEQNKPQYFMIKLNK